MLAAESARMPSAERRMSPHYHLLAVDGDHAIAAPQSRLVSRRPLGYALHEIAAHVVRHVEQVEHVVREEFALRAAPEGLLLEKELLGRLHGHHEAQPFASSRLRDVVADDPDDLPRRVEHGPAGIAGVDG